MTKLIEANPWQILRRFTPARIALGRAGDSLPTEALLDFGLAHAQARDAVHVPLDVTSILQQLAAAGYESITVHSAVIDRNQYLRRPDAGRRLDAVSSTRLRAVPATVQSRLVIVIADGLSPTAAMRHAVPLLKALRPWLSGWVLAPIVVAEQARVALGDEIGELLGAELAAVLIGERPGLSSPDGLGIYLTYSPRIGRTDAERNCISNIRPEGLGYEPAARRLALLLNGARRLGRSGVAMKDQADEAPLSGPALKRRKPLSDPTSSR
jgi:ethanolamine ammonia-lyase small subunit